MLFSLSQWTMVYGKYWFLLFNKNNDICKNLAFYRLFRMERQSWDLFLSVFGCISVFCLRKIVSPITNFVHLAPLFETVSFFFFCFSRIVQLCLLQFNVLHLKESKKCYWKLILMEKLLRSFVKVPNLFFIKIKD